MHTDLDPNEEQARIRAMLSSNFRFFVYDSGGSKDDWNGQSQSQRRNVDHVACDDAEVEDLHVELAHLGEGSLVLFVLPAIGRLVALALGVDLVHAAAAVEEACLFRSVRLLMLEGAIVGGRVTDDSLEGDIGGIRHVVGVRVVQRLETLARETRGGALGEVRRHQSERGVERVAVTRVDAGSSRRAGRRSAGVQQTHRRRHRQKVEREGIMCVKHREEGGTSSTSLETSDKSARDRLPSAVMWL